MSKAIDPIFSPITVTIKYDSVLQLITGIQQEPALISPNMPFAHMLFSIFQSYPEIEAMYPPGTIGLLVNDSPPTIEQILEDGDIIYLSATAATGSQLN